MQIEQITMPLGILRVPASTDKLFATVLEPCTKEKDESIIGGYQSMQYFQLMGPRILLRFDVIWLADKKFVNERGQK